MIFLFSEHVLTANGMRPAWLGIEEGRIQKISESAPAGPCMDCRGLYVLPGMINLKSENIFREMSLRSNQAYPIEKILRETEVRLVSSGVTTAFHSVPASYDEFSAKVDLLSPLLNAESIGHRAPLIRHRVHMDFRMGFVNNLDQIKDILEQKAVDYISYQGYGQSEEQEYKDSYYTVYVQNSLGVSEETAQKMLARIRDWRSESNLEELAYMVKYAHFKGISSGCSDLRTAKSLGFLNKDGFSIMESVRPESVKFAFENDKGLAADIARFQKNPPDSLLLEHSSKIILYSAMRPQDLLYEIFRLSEAIGLEKAWQMVSENPARLLDLQDCGSLREGAYADLLVVDAQGQVPVVRAVWSQGRPVYGLEALAR